MSWLSHVSPSRVGLVGSRRVPTNPGDESRRLLGTPDGELTSRILLGASWDALVRVCDLILPADEDGGGAIEAGAPAFIDEVAAVDPDCEVTLKGGLTMLDAVCTKRFGAVFVACTESQQMAVLDGIATRSATQDPNWAHGRAFFLLVRRLTVDAFATSAVGLRYLQYEGNLTAGRFEGCRVDERRPSSGQAPATADAESQLTSRSS